MANIGRILTLPLSGCVVYTFGYIVYMATNTLSARLEESETALIDELAKNAGFDRSTFVKQLLRRGIAAERMSQAVDDYRCGKVSLSRAAEIADVSAWDFIAQMEDHGLELHYGSEELGADLKVLEEAGR